MFEQFTEKAIRVIMLAQEETRRLGHNFVGTEQILLGLIGEGTGIAAQTLKSLGANLADARAEVETLVGRGPGFVGGEVPFTPFSKNLFKLSRSESQKLGHRYIGTEHLLLGLTQGTEGMATQVLERLGLDLIEIRNQVIFMVSGPTVILARKKKASSKISLIDTFGQDLTQLAAMGKLDPVVGRGKEVERIIQILGRRTKNNPILIGEPGVGKTALVEGLVQRIMDSDVPMSLVCKRILSLNISSLIAGTKYRGEFEDRLQGILQEIMADGDVILVIDEVHTLIGAGAVQGGLDAAAMLKPALARGQLQCIGATTLAEYSRYIEQDAALERRFQPVMVNQPTDDETVLILKGVRNRYEQHHQLKISDLALEAAVRLSKRYLPERFLPDKAIDLMDEAGSRVQIAHSKQFSPATGLNEELRQVLKDKGDAVQRQDYVLASKMRDRELQIQKQVSGSTQGQTSLVSNIEYLPTVGEEDIAHIVASWTGIPVKKLTEAESIQLQQMEHTLHQRIIGQEEAIQSVCRAIRRARVGLKHPNRPIASFIFSGSTGVGKTELVKAIAASLFDSDSAMIRLDMSEYMERHSISKMIGAAPGYAGYDEGGQLTEAVRRQPYCVILFDEIEKAHPDVFNLLLQVLEEGCLTDSRGRTVDFSNTVLIMTSNLGSRVIQNKGGHLGFSSIENFADAHHRLITSIVNEELKQFFRPEFLNRIDEVIVFRQLTQAEVRQIANLLLLELFARLAERNIQIDVTERFKDRLVAAGYHAELGARPLRRAMTHLLENYLADEILAGRIKAGDMFLLDIDDEKMISRENQDRPMVRGQFSRKFEPV
jgi:ATP-dependent Clp protease ATP-binding subunit ClpC